MEIDSLLQLRLSVQAAMLGWVLGLFYDLLRTVRRHSAAAIFATALDILYALSIPLALLRFALHAAGGELRVYHLLCCCGGLVFFFRFCSAPLRPLWDFWARMVLRLCAIALLPLRTAHKVFTKFFLFVKKLFYFHKKSYIMRRSLQWSLPPMKRRTAHGGKTKTAKDLSADGVGAGRSGRAVGSARESWQSFERRQGTGADTARTGSGSCDGKRNAAR